MCIESKKFLMDILPSYLVTVFLSFVLLWAIVVISLEIADELYNHIDVLTFLPSIGIEDLLKYIQIALTSDPLSVI
jgi:hypothetical protein